MAVARKAHKADDDKWGAFCDDAGLKRTQIKALEAKLAKQEVADIQPKSDDIFEAFLKELGLDRVTEECKRTRITTFETLVAHKADEVGCLLG